MTGAKVAVVGLDPDGFSFAELTAERGFQTIGFDPDEVKVAQLDEYANERSERSLSITSDAAQLRDCDIFVLYPPTDISGGAQDLAQLEAAATVVGAHLREGTLVIVESIVFPGVCEHVVLPLIEKTSGLARPASDRSRAEFFFAHAPATQQGSRRAIGAAGPESLSRASAFYRALGIDTTAMRSIKEVEAIALVENSLHDVALALSSEFAILFDRIGIDIANVAKAVAVNASVFSGMALPRTSPSAYFLSRSGHEHEIDQQFLASARRIVEYMPTYVVNVLSDALREQRVELKKVSVALLGISNGNGTGEEGIGAKIGSALAKKGVRTRTYDPDVAGAGFDLKETLEGADAAIIAGDQPMFRSLSPRQFEELGVRVVIDARNILDKDAFEKSSVVYRGVGRG